MLNTTKTISIIGASSFAKELYSHIYSDHPLKNTFKLNFYVDDKYLVNTSIKLFNKYIVKPISEIDIPNSLVTIAIADPLSRFLIVDRLSKDIEYFTFIHSSCKILNEPSINIGTGSTICAGTVITCDVTIGNHTHLNLNTTVGHDTVIGDYFTTAPGVNISGNVTIGERVYVGTNASIKEKINICDNVTIGMGATVVHDITVPGTYVGTPARRL